MNRKKPGTKTDELTPFRWYMHRVRGRRFLSIRGTTDLTEQYLMKLWVKQGGKCPLTGWKLYLPRTSRGGWPDKLRAASLDRIDSSVGYVIGNVQFVSVMANMAKNSYSEYELIEFCKAVAHNCMDIGAILGK